MSGNFTRLASMLTDQSFREDIFRDEFVIKKKEFIVDTVYAPDVMKWETGIQVNGKSWIIAEEYEERKEAKKKHKAWVSKIKKNPNMKLKECRSAMDWFFGDG